MCIVKGASIEEVGLGSVFFPASLDTRTCPLCLKLSHQLIEFLGEL